MQHPAVAAAAVVAACGSSGSATTSQTQTTVPVSTTTASTSSSTTTTTPAVGTAAANLGLGAAAVHVSMTGDATDPNGARFVPAAVTVPAGGIVQWDYDANAFVPHNMIFPDNDSISSPHTGLGTKPNGDPGLSMWQIKFATPGTYHYQCSFHLPGMVGTVTVTS